MNLQMAELLYIEGFMVNMNQESCITKQKIYGI